MLLDCWALHGNQVSIYTCGFCADTHDVVNYWDPSFKKKNTKMPF